jgi:hypothetical protein
LPNVLPITPGLLGLMPGGTPRTGAVEPPAPPTDALVRIDFPYYRPPVRPWYPPISGGTGGSPNWQQVPPFGPPPIYVMPPVWTGTPYRPWPPYDGVSLPPIPTDSWGHKPWWLRGPVLRIDPLELQPRPGQPILPPEPNISVPPPPQTTPPAPPKQEPPPPPPQPEPVKTTPPKQPTTWSWDYWREGRQD